MLSAMRMEKIHFVLIEQNIREMKGRSFLL